MHRCFPSHTQRIASDQLGLSDEEMEVRLHEVGVACKEAQPCLALPKETQSLRKHLLVSFCFYDSLCCGCCFKFCVT